MDYIKFLLNKYNIRITISKLKNEHKDIVLKSTEFLNEKYESISLGQRLYHIKHNIYHIIKCKYCNINPAKYHSSHKYGTCSTKCSNKIKRFTMEKTCLIKYGVKNTSKLIDKMDKMVKTNRKNHDGKWSNQIEAVKEKRRITCLKKYGVDHNTKISGYIPFYTDDLTKIRMRKKKHIKRRNKSIMNGVENIFNLISYGNILKLCDKRDNSIFTINKNTFHTRKYRGDEISIIKNPLKKWYSLLEKEILNFIKIHYKYKIINNSKSIIYPYEIDIFLPYNNLAIEINGDHWHANPNLYDADDEIIFSNKKMKAKDIWIKDNHKKEICNNKNIKLITIWEMEWKMNKKCVQDYLLTIL